MSSQHDPEKMHVTHPVYASLNRPLLLCMVDRRVFYTAVLAGVLPWAFIQRIVGIPIGIAFGVGIWGIGLGLGSHDPQFLSVALLKISMRRRYDCWRRL